MTTICSHIWGKNYPKGNIESIIVGALEGQDANKNEKVVPGRAPGRKGGLSYKHHRHAQHADDQRQQVAEGAILFQRRDQVR